MWPAEQQLRDPLTDKSFKKRFLEIIVFTAVLHKVPTISELGFVVSILTIVVTDWLCLMSEMNWQILLQQNKNWMEAI